MPIIQHHDEKIVLVPGNKAPISPGESPKYFLTDGHNSYIVKKPKARSFAGIFKKNFPKNLEHYKNWTLSDFYAKQETLPVDHKTKLLPYLQHLKDVLFEAAFGEVLYQLIAKALFRSYEAMESYLHIDEVTAEPCIISRFRDDFNEFIEKRMRTAMGITLVKASEWDKRKIPRRDDLNFDDHENYLLGKLYALALITHDWDVVNNIMLSNSGCIGDSHQAEKITVVDGGNKFHFGYNGLTCDESAFENREFNTRARKQHPITGYNFTLPFDEAVFLGLPRLLIQDLFSLSNPCVFKGFQDGIEEARIAIALNPFCIQQAINRGINFITKDSNRETIKRLNHRSSTLINHSYYYPQRSDDYSLATILKARCLALTTISKRLKKGEPIEVINQETLASYRQAQELCSPPKKKTATQRSNSFFLLPELDKIRDIQMPLFRSKL